MAAPWRRLQADPTLSYSKSITSLGRRPAPPPRAAGAGGDAGATAAAGGRGRRARLQPDPTSPYPQVIICPPPQALEEALAPRLRLAGEGAALQRFGEFFQGRELEKGTEVVMLWRPEGAVELALRRAGGPELSQARRAAASRRPVEP